MTSTYFSIQKSSVSAKLTLPKLRRASLRGGFWLPPAQRGSLLIPEFTEQMVHYLVSDELSLMELCEHPFSEGFLNTFEVSEGQRTVVRIVVVVPVVVVVANTPTINIKPASLPKPFGTHHRLSAYTVLTVEFNSEGLRCR